MSTYVYFSFVVQATAGFGDITAISPFVRSFVTLEMILGVTYLAVLIGRLINAISGIHEQDPEPHSKMEEMIKEDIEAVENFLFISAAASFPVRMLLVALEYLPLFFVFYLANSIRVNSASRFEGQSEWASMLIMGLGNSVGLMAILAIQYGNLGFSTTVFWTNEWIYMDLLFGVIPMMFILPYFNRFFFRMTGRVYLGPMVTCLVFIMMMLTSNVCYIPLR